VKSRVLRNKEERCRLKTNNRWQKDHQICLQIWAVKKKKKKKKKKKENEKEKITILH
jgi:hypothetical protein